MIGRWGALGAIGGLLAMAGCASPSPRPMAVTPPVDQSAPDARPSPAAATPTPVAPPARSGSGRGSVTGSGASAPAVIEIPGDPLPRTPPQTIVPPPVRRPLP